jgi:hypothetical protein
MTAGLLLLSGWVATTGWIWAHQADAPDAGDADLAAPRSQVAPGDNGFRELAAAADRLEWPAEADARIQAIRADETRYGPWLAQVLERNRPALESLRRAVRAPAFQFPARAGEWSEEALAGLLQRARRLIDLAGVEARVRLAPRNAERALERALLGMDLGQRLAAAEGVDSVAFAAAMACQERSLTDLEAVVRSVPVDAERARGLSDRLGAARWQHAQLARMWAEEYQIFKARTQAGIRERLDELARTQLVLWWRPSGLTPDYLLQPNRTMALLADLFRSHQQRSALDCRASAALQPSEQSGQRTRAQDLVHSNAAGRQVVARLAPGLECNHLLRCQVQTRISLLQALIASKAYWHEHEALPASLAELVPEYLAAEPPDRFGGGALAYSPAQERVYSVGSDFSDAGGGETPDPRDASEPGLSLAFASDPAQRAASRTAAGAALSTIECLQGRGL